MDRSPHYRLGRTVWQKLFSTAVGLFGNARRSLDWRSSLGRRIASSVQPYEPSEASSADQTLPAPAELFFDRLLDQVDPRRPALDGSVAQARIYAGRWLALRRIRRGLSNCQIEERTGIAPPTLLLLEAGLADDLLAPAQAWEQLGAALAGTHREYPHVAAVVDVALGRANTMQSHTMAQVGSDLRHCDREPRDIRARAARGARVLGKHRKGLALLGLLASLIAFWRRRPAALWRPGRGLPEKRRAASAKPQSRQEHPQSDLRPARLVLRRAPFLAAARRSGKPSARLIRRLMRLAPFKPKRRSGEVKKRRSPRQLITSLYHKRISLALLRFGLIRRFATSRLAGMSIDFRLKLSRGEV
jgi:hypothetical protein